MVVPEWPMNEKLLELEPSVRLKKRKPWDSKKIKKKKEGLLSRLEREMRSDKM